MIKFWIEPIRTLTQLIKGQVPQVREVRYWYSQALAREVNIDLYLPPDYTQRTSQVYPLVILNDGQDLPGMQIQKILADLYKKRRIPHAIIVGVHAGERLQEYGTALMQDYKGRGARAELYRQFILNELMPYLRDRFRITSEVEHTAIAGFSLGGLSAFDIGYGAPHTFGVIGVFSGSFWWRHKESPAHNPDEGRIMHELVSRGPYWGGAQRYWMQVGLLDETDDRNHNGVIDSVDDTRDLIQILLEKKVPQQAIRYLELAHGKHDQATWAEALPDFLQWALNSQHWMD